MLILELHSSVIVLYLPVSDYSTKETFKKSSTSTSTNSGYLSAPPNVTLSNACIMKVLLDIKSNYSLAMVQVLNLKGRPTICMHAINFL